MKIWAIADLHLSFGATNKSMEVFGPIWKDYQQKIEFHWREHVHDADLVLIAGDISWAMHREEAQKDLDFIDKLPGVKVLIKGNHDYWWGTSAKVKKDLPASLHLIQNSAFTYKNISIGGARLWASKDIRYDGVTCSEQDEKIYLREIERLKLSLSQLDPKATFRIAMTHYPPISLDLSDSKTSKTLEEFHIDVCVFGHLHNLSRPVVFGEKNKVQYFLTAADYLEFAPKEILYST